MKDKHGKQVERGDIILVAGLYIVVMEDENKFRLVFDYDRSVKEDEYESTENVTKRKASEREIRGNILTDDVEDVIQKHVHEVAHRAGWDKPIYEVRYEVEFADGKGVQKHTAGVHADDEREAKAYIKNMYTRGYADYGGTVKLLSLEILGVQKKQ